MISPATLKSWIADGRELAILDAREEGEFGASHMFWAVPCPLSQAPLRAPLLLPNRGTRVVCVDARFLDASFVGREFDLAYINSLPPGVDACGENGEFHAFVYDGPNFSHPVAYKSLGLKTSQSLPVLGKLTYHFDLLDI